MGLAWRVGQGLLRSFPKLRQEPGPFGPHACKTKRLSAATGDDDKVDAIRHQAIPRPKAFPAGALYAVPNDRIAHLGGDDHSEPRRARRAELGSDQAHKVRPRHAARARLNPQKIRAAPNSAISTEQLPDLVCFALFGGRHRTSVLGRRHARRNRETVTSCKSSPRGGRAPYAVGSRAHCAHRGFPYGHGIRASSRGASYGADRCVSWLISSDGARR